MGHKSLCKYLSAKIQYQKELIEISTNEMLKVSFKNDEHHIGNFGSSLQSVESLLDCGL